MRERGRLHLTLHCHHQNDSALRQALTRAALIKFKKKKIIEGQSHKTVPVNINKTMLKTKESRGGIELKGTYAIVVDHLQAIFRS